MDRKIFVVTPGHYQSVHTLNSESKHIIRIVESLGDGIWIDSDGKRYSESDIENNWIAMNTSTTETSGPTRKIQTLLGDFRPIIVDVEQPAEIVQPVVHTFKTEPVAEQQSVIQQPVVQEPIKQFNEMEFLLQKASIETLNETNQRKYGQPLYNEYPVISLGVKVTIPYDLEKVKQIIELFELDANKVVDYLYGFVEIPERIIKRNLFETIMGLAKLNHTPINETTPPDDSKISDVQRPVPSNNNKEKSPSVQQQAGSNSDWFASL